MKAVEIRELSQAELADKLKDLKAELFNLRFQLAVKRDIARVKTVIRQRELQQ